MDSFSENVRWNLRQVTVQVEHANKVNGRAKSGYYKAAIIMAASVVEALAYKILEQNNTALEMPFEDWEYKNCSILPSRYKSVDGCNLVICETYKPVFCLNKHTDFSKVNRVCAKLGIFSDGFFMKIDKVRELRNKIHIQGLGNIDRSYTKKELEFVSSVLEELLEKFAK